MVLRLDENLYKVERVQLPIIENPVCPSECVRMDYSYNGLYFMCLKLDFMIRLMLKEIIFKGSLRRVNLFLTKEMKFSQYA